MGLEKTLKSPLDNEEIWSVNPKGNQSWIFVGRIDVKAETPILWPPGMKNWLIEKTPMLGKIEGGGEGDDRGWDGWMASLMWWTWVWGRLRELVMDRETRHAVVNGVTKSWARLSNWTEWYIRKKSKAPPHHLLNE